MTKTVENQSVSTKQCTHRPEKGVGDLWSNGRYVGLTEDVEYCVRCRAVRPRKACGTHHFTRIPELAVQHCMRCGMLSTEIQYDERLSMAEGWLLANVDGTLEIQRYDAYGAGDLGFASDTQALDYVTKRAERSAYHAAMLALTKAARR